MAGTIIGTTISGTFADGTGHVNQSHLIYAENAQVWWLFVISSANDLFGNPGTHVIDAYFSSTSNLNSATWTKSTSSPNFDASTSGSNTTFDSGNGGGRSLGCAYVNNAAGTNKDLVVCYASMAFVAGSQNSYNGLIRAVVTGNAITWGNWGGWDAPAWNLVAGSTSMVYGNAVGVTADGYVQMASAVMHSELDANVCTTVDPVNVDTWNEGAITATGNTTSASGQISSMSNQSRLEVGMAISGDGTDWSPNRFPNIATINSGTAVTVTGGTSASATTTGLSVRWWQGTTGSNRTNTMIDNNMAHECDLYAFAPLASNGMLLVYSDGGGTNGQPTDFKSMKASQTQAQGFWPNDTTGVAAAAVFGSAVTIDAYDWSLIPVSTSNIYTVRRATTTSITVRKYTTGTDTWAAETAPPATPGTIKAGGGVVGITDGTDYWLFVIDSTNNNIIYNKYVVGTNTWDTSWSVLTAVGSTAKSLSGYINQKANQNAVMWTEQNGSNFDTLVASLAFVTTELQQQSFQFRFDDGSESAAKAFFGHDTPIIRPVTTNTRLRVLVDAVNLDPASTQYRLEYAKNGGAWTPVATSQPTTTVPTYGAATELSGTGAISGLPMPSGSIGDLLLLLVNTANEAISVTTSGWTQVTNSPQSTGTAAAAGGVRLGVYWRVRDGTEPTVSIADSGSYTYAKVIRLSGVDTSAPINITAGSVDSTATNNLTAPGVTTTVANCLIVHIVGLDKDLADVDTFTGTATNANLANITERFDTTVNAGAGGGLLILTGEKATAGATGNTTATAGFDTSTTHAYITVAGAPTPVAQEPLLVSLSGNFAPGATTAQMNPPPGKSTTDFTAGRIEEAANPATAVDIGSSGYTELEWCLTAVSGQASTNDVFTFRVTANGTVLGSYLVTPQWTIGTTPTKSRPSFPKGLRISPRRKVVS
jgi:hypothetical protein